MIDRTGGIILTVSLAQDCKELEPGLKLISANHLHLPSLRSKTMKLGDYIVSYIENTECIYFMFTVLSFST